MSNLLRIAHDEPGPTGKLSPGKIIGWFWTFVAAYISIHYLAGFGFGPAFSFWEWLISSFTMGVMSVGFFWGLAQGAFSTIVDALKVRIEGD